MNPNIMIGLFVNAFIFILWIGVFISVQFLKKTGVITNPTVAHVTYVIALIVPIIMGITMFVGRNTWHPVNAFFYTISSSWIIIVAGLFFSVIIAWIGFLIMNATSINIPAYYFGIAALLGMTVFAGYGIIHGRTIVTKKVAVEHPVIMAAIPNMRIALVSDLHIGLVRRENWVRKVTERIMQEKPDMIIIAGDLIDGPHFPYAEFLGPLSELSAPYGVYFTPGNHEGYNNENEKFYQGLPDNVTVIADDVIPIPGTELTIAGFDYATETQDEFTKRAQKVVQDTTPTIGILHDPKYREVLGDMGIPLVVSGHTHGGQFFPGTFVVRRLYKEKIQGLVNHDFGAYYTTTGVGTAVSPARVGTDAEVVILEISE
jgi:predicted MPP superfamily phosphohydrolase